MNRTPLMCHGWLWPSQKFGCGADGHAALTLKTGFAQREERPLNTPIALWNAEETF